ncbi:hypothetical protein [Neptuniibacter sp. CAU 1671]|uniref:hypothetical protein n=1 Tax=Neptuniibacter sp. CAU 1671 TaxID=3032593 RepID=UPI0023DA8FB6|nr:hypothetical protein [Neptuniibacter sp. CAU 1671]MDF2181463.1 hypothetical protein [Neptuniibacter sp. CAU 1671]
MKRIYITLALMMLTFSAVTSAEESPIPEHWQLWLQQLPELMQQQSDTSKIYLKNYMQCMDDQQALKQDPDQSLVDALKNALDSGEACQPLLEAWLEALKSASSANESRPEKSL